MHAFSKIETDEMSSIQKNAGIISVLAVVFGILTIILGFMVLKTKKPTTIDTCPDQILPSESILPIAKAVNDTIGAAAAYKGQFNHKPSPYHRHLNFYNQKPTTTIVLLPQFQTYQQTYGWTCGASASLMVLNFLKFPNISEDLLSKEYDLTRGANTEEMVNVFQKRGYTVISSNDAVGGANYFPDTPFFTRDMTTWLSAGIPIMIKLGGHWSVIIGYDNMGKPDSYQDHVLILADSWDTHDHQQDGYIIYTFDYFWNLWTNSAMKNEPTKYQQFVVAKPKI